MDRRSFLKTAAAAGTFVLATSQSGFAQAVAAGAKPGKVRLACVGIGNRGAEVLKAFSDTGEADIVALCDTDLGAPHTLASLKAHPTATQFRDFRRMFDRMAKDIDAVCVCTPDFSHFPVAMLAMSLGKPVYVEKPMGHSFRQMELMMAAEKRYKVATQMGNQGHSEANYFQFKAWTEAGIIRNVTRITAFMNNPRRWHGKKFDAFLPGMPVPASLDYDTWLATARQLEYNVGYMNGDWRSWYELGNGALGDWGAHIFDTAHEFLELGLPVEVDPVKIEGHSPWIFPQASTLVFKFPARGTKPPLELTWYDGQQNLPPLPENFGSAVVDPNIPPPSKGSIDTQRNPPGKVIYGEGLTFKGGSHASTLQILTDPKGGAPALSLPVVPKTTSNHFLNFLRACQGTEKCRSPFSVAGPLCQAMSLGILAQRVNAPVRFDPVARRITNHALANEMLAGVPPRREWEQFYRL
jgi:hypothetical protein